MGWCQLYNLNDMIAETYKTYSLMPMCSDVKNCLFGDGTLCYDILLASLFWISVFVLVLLSCFALLALL